MNLLDNMEDVLLNRPFSEYSKQPMTMADMLCHLRLKETSAYTEFSQKSPVPSIYKEVHRGELKMRNYAIRTTLPHRYF